MNKSMKKRIIEVIDYNSAWPACYLNEIEQIKNVLFLEIIKAYHIGSTSVPGLAAKPVIDILLKVKDVIKLDDYNNEMFKIGYIAKGEHEIPERRFYLKGEIDRTHHIHAFNEHSVNIKRHLAFRDYLIKHPYIAQQYGNLKRKNAQLCKGDANKYCDLKNDFLKYHEQKAVKWYKLKNTII